MYPELLFDLAEARSRELRGQAALARRVRGAGPPRPRPRARAVVGRGLVRLGERLVADVPSARRTLLR